MFRYKASRPSISIAFPRCHRLIGSLYLIKLSSFSSTLSTVIPHSPRAQSICQRSSCRVASGVTGLTDSKMAVTSKVFGVKVTLIESKLHCKVRQVWSGLSRHLSADSSYSQQSLVGHGPAWPSSRTKIIVNLKTKKPKST